MLSAYRLGGPTLKNRSGVPNSNQLTGPIPAELGQMGAVTHLRLSANPQLTGQEAFQGHMQAHHPDCELEL